MVKVEVIKQQYKEIATPLLIRYILERADDIIIYDKLKILLKIGNGKILIKRKVGNTYFIKYTTKDLIITGKITDLRSYITDYTTNDKFKMNGSDIEIIYKSDDGDGEYLVKSDLKIKESYLINILSSIHLFNLLTRYELEGYIKIL